MSFQLDSWPAGKARKSKSAFKQQAKTRPTAEQEELDLQQEERDTLQTLAGNLSHRDLQHLLEKAFVPFNAHYLWTTLKGNSYDFLLTLRRLGDASEEPRHLTIRRVLKLTQDLIASRSAPVAEEPAGTTKRSLRSSDSIYNLLKWDTRFCDRLDDVLIGYTDRFTGIQEISFNDFSKDVSSDLFIPWHRVQYFKDKTTNALLWDRQTRADNVTARQ